MKKKHIVIDARHLEKSTGVYMQNLLQRLAVLPHAEVRISALIPPSLRNEWSSRYPDVNFIGADQPWYSFSEQLQLAWQLYTLRPHLVHFCMPQQPILYFGKRVTTIHDLTLVHFDNIDIPFILYKLRKFIFMSLLFISSYRSKFLIVPTNYTRKDIAKSISKRLEKKVVVTYEAGEPLSTTAESIQSLEGEDFLVFIGNAFPYKNIKRIIDAYTTLKQSHPDLKLVLAGRKDMFYEELEKYTTDNDIQGVSILGFVSEAEKRWLFQNAKAYVVASLSEGFHIPGLEAMYEGCPVVSSSATCLPEVYEDAAHYFNPLDVKDMAHAIGEVLTEEKLRAILVSKGKQQVEKYSWEKMAQQTYDVYMRALE